MWIYLLPHLNLLPDERVDDMAIRVWTLFTTSPPPKPNEDGEDLSTFTPTVQLLLSLIDPYAQWFVSWIQQLLPGRAVCLLHQTGLVRFILFQWQTFLSPFSYTCTDCKSNHNISTYAHDHIHTTNNRDVMESTRRLQLLSILRSIFFVTRVTLFPWDQVHVLTDMNETTKGTAATAKACMLAVTTAPPSFEQLERVLSPFLAMLRTNILHPSVAAVNEKLMAICTETIQIIIAGTTARTSNAIECSSTSCKVLADTIHYLLKVEQESHCDGETNKFTISSLCATLILEREWTLVTLRVGDDDDSSTALQLIIGDAQMLLAAVERHSTTTNTDMDNLKRILRSSRVLPAHQGDTTLQS